MDTEQLMDAIAQVRYCPYTGSNAEDKSYCALTWIGRDSLNGEHWCDLLSSYQLIPYHQMTPSTTEGCIHEAVEKYEAITMSRSIKVLL